MRLLIVSYYGGDHYSSTAQNTRLLTESLITRGHEVHVVCAGPRTETVTGNQYTLSQIAIVEAGSRAHRFSPWQPNQAVRSVANRIIASWQPDVIYMGAWKHLMDFALAGCEQGIPVVQMVHDYSVLCLRSWLVDSWGNICSGPTTDHKCLKCVSHIWTWKGKLKNLLLTCFRFISGQGGKPSATLNANDALSYLHRYQSAISVFIAQSPSVTDVLQQAGIQLDRCRFLPQYIGEAKLWHYARPLESPGENRPVRYAYVGRWSKEKGVDVLIEAFSQAETTNRVELWIFSKEASRSAIEASIVGLNTPYKTVKIICGLEGGEMSSQLAQCDVCVVPSSCIETASRAVLEANAQNLPVIVSNTVGNRYVVQHGVNGLVFPSKDVSELARAISYTANNPDMLAEWSAHIPAPFTRDKWANTLGAILTDVVNPDNY